MEANKTIYSIIEELRSTNSSNEKVAIIKKYSSNELLKKVLFFTYNPRYVYNISKIPQVVVYNPMEKLDDSLDKLLSLVDRTYTGKAGIDFLEQILRLSEEPEVIKLIINRDLKAGISTAGINKVFQDLIPEEPYQGCMSFKEKLAVELFKNSKQVISQIKADGQYLNSLIDINKDILLSSRSGKKCFIDGILVQQLQQIKAYNVVLNGELTIKGMPPSERSLANGIISSIISINEKLKNGIDITKETKAFNKEHKCCVQEMEDRIKYVVWDIIEYDEYLSGVSKTDYKFRLERLEELTKDLSNIEVVEYKLVDTYQEAIGHFKEALENGEEGTVIKDLYALWQDGKHKHQLKMKLEMDLDLKIIGFNEGKGKYNGTLGSLIVSTCDDLLVSGCGSLKEKDGLRDEIWNNKEKYLERIVKVKCNGLSKNRQGGNSLLFPAFDCVRDDKTIANSFEECVAIQEMKIALK